MRIYKHTSNMEIKKINSLNFKFDYQNLKYKLKNELIAFYGIKTLLIFLIPS
jgi:hypothetical protein